MLTLMPGTGRPAWVPTALVSLSASQSRISCLGQATLASGEVSVIPHACTMGMSKSRGSAR